MSTDAARSVLSDPRAPADEKFDAQSELEKGYRPNQSDLIPSAAFAPVMEAMRNGSIGEVLGEGLSAKAGNVMQFPQKRGRRSAKEGMRSTRLDEMSVQVGGEYYEKPGAIDFQGLRRMVDGTPILSSVIITRIRQMSRFCQPSEDGGLGFSVRHVDKEHEAEDGEKEQMKLLTKFFQHSGWEWKPRPRKRLKRDTFGTLMAKLMRDTLTFDACPFETEFTRDRKGIDGLYAVDGGTIRLCTEEGYEGDDEIYALQVVNGRVATTYDLDQLVYEVRNPRTDVTLAGYGLGETELLIRTVTALLNAISYNADFFDKNSIPKGLLQIFGDYSQEDVSAFRRHWKQMVAGVENKYGLPVMVSKDKESGAVYTPFNSGADEMAFAKWLTFLTSIVCAVYSIDPNEIGFESFSANKSTMSGNDTAEKLAAGRDKGFRPIASFFESIFTDFVVADFNPDYCFRFEGLEEEDKDRAWEAKKLVCTVDEIRAEEGYKPMPDKRIGDLPVNPALIQPSMQLQHPDAVNPQPDGNDFGPDAVQGQPQDQGEGDFGADPAEQKEEGESDFGPDQPEAKEDPQDFGADQPEKKDDFGKALAQSETFGFGRWLRWLRK
jgi:hypothetical protein